MSMWKNSSHFKLGYKLFYELLRFVIISKSQKKKYYLNLSTGSIFYIMILSYV